jgi:alpha-methylacyl-CoA racemase
VRDGPLADVRVLELGGIGPVPFATMMLADLGASVTVLERTPRPAEPFIDGCARVLTRGKRSIALDLKDERVGSAIWSLIARADVVVEGFRPGAVERLGFGPDAVRDAHPHIVYVRVTGWGQTGQRAQLAGHDINYIATAGLLQQFGQPDRPPVPPLNIMGDFAGGALFAVIGILAALHERSESGVGQVVDAAMVDGAAYLNAMTLGLISLGVWSEDRGSKDSDGSRPYYTTYETADGKYLALGCLEDRFYANLLAALELDGPEWDRSDPREWPRQRSELTAIFSRKTLAEWCAHFGGTDACVSPVWTPTEAAADPVNVERTVFNSGDGAWAANPAPRFSRSTTTTAGGPVPYGADAVDVLLEAGLSAEEVAGLMAAGSVVDPTDQLGSSQPE